MLVAQSFLTLCDPANCSPPGSSVHGILQARILEWVAIPSSRGSSWPKDQTQVSRTAGRLFTVWATREVLYYDTLLWYLSNMGFPGGASGKEPAYQKTHSIRVGKIPWRRAWQPTPVFLPGKSHGQTSLVGHTESDTTEATEHAHI